MLLFVYYAVVRMLYYSSSAVQSGFMLLRLSQSITLTFAAPVAVKVSGETGVLPFSSVTVCASTLSSLPSAPYAAKITACVPVSGTVTTAFPSLYSMLYFRAGRTTVTVPYSEVYVCEPSVVSVGSTLVPAVHTVVLVRTGSVTDSL